MTTILLVSLAGCFLAQWLLAGLNETKWVMDWLALSANGIKSGLVYQLLTFQFLHGGVWHLLMNMVGLYFFGRAMEEMLGKKGMLTLYLASGAIGGLLQVGLAFAFPHTFRPEVEVVGASAGVFGLIAAFATRTPEQPITLLIFFFLPVTFKAKVLLLIEACIAVAGVLGTMLHPLFNTNIANGAHLGGMLTGIAWIRWSMMTRPRFNFWRPFRRSQPRRESRRTAPQRSWKTASRKSEDIPSAEFISREVDPILEKISAHGIHSLTERERQILEAARSKMARR